MGSDLTTFVAVPSSNLFADTALIGNVADPIQMTVLAGACCATASSAFGSGLSYSIAGFPSSFQIRCRDRFGNPVTAGGQSFVALASSRSTKMRTVRSTFIGTDVGNGIYGFWYRISRAVGSYSLHVQLLDDSVGLSATYYASETFRLPVYTKSENTVDYSLDAGAKPSSSMPPGSPYSVRWSGFVRPQYVQVYTFFAGVQTAVERMKLWVDNSLLVDQWTSISATEKSGTLMIGTANGYYDVVMEYKQPSGTGVAQGAKLSWQSNNAPKSVILASSLTQSSHISASPFIVHHDDCWTAVGTSGGEVIGGMQITVVGHGFDNTGSSFYKCVFGQTPFQSHGPSGMKSGYNFLEGSNSSVESVPVFPISSSKIVCILDNSKL